MIIEQLLDELNDSDDAAVQELLSILSTRLDKNIPIQDSLHRVQQTWLANSIPVTTDGAGNSRDPMGDAYFDRVNLGTGLSATVNEDEPRQIDITASVTGGQLCYDIFLSEDGSSVYPSIQDPPNIFSTMQAAADYAAALEALGATAIRFWVCPKTTTYGDATITNGNHVWYIDASANDTGMGSGVPYLSDSIIGDLTFGDGSQVAIAIDLVIRNTRMGTLTIAPGAGEMFLWLDLNNAIITSIGKGTGSGNLHLQSANWVRGAVGDITLDSFQGCRFVQSTTGLITVADMHVAEFVGCHIGGMIISNTFQNLTVVGGKNEFGATSNSFIYMTLANVSHPTISGNNRGLVVDANNCDAITATRTFVNNAGSVSIKGACILGNTIPVNGGTPVFATGPFQDGTFGPNSPDAVSYYSGVTGTGNSFYPQTTGGSAAPVDATYVTMSLNGTLTNERVLTAGTGISVTDAGPNSTVTIATTVTNYIKQMYISFGEIPGVPYSQ